MMDLFFILSNSERRGWWWTFFFILSKSERRGWVVRNLHRT